jgi:hypothetical protein
MLAHGPVAHRVGARGRGRGHTAQRGVGPRIDREKDARVAQVLVQLLARNPRLNPAVQILGMDLQNLVHLAEVYGDAAVHRHDLALQGRAGAKRNDRAIVPRADLDDGRHLLARPHEGDRIGKGRRVIGRILAVVPAYRLGG